MVPVQEKTADSSMIPDLYHVEKQEVERDGLSRGKEGRGTPFQHHVVDHPHDKY